MSHKNEIQHAFFYHENQRMDVKVCRSCGLDVHVLEFSVNKRYKDGRESRCKSCSSQYYVEHAEQKREALAKWRKNNPNYQIQYRQISDKRKEYEREYYLKNKERYHLNKIRNRQENMQRESQYRNQYRNHNRDIVNAYHRKWKTNKRSYDIEYKLRENIGRRIRYELNTLMKTGKNKNDSTLSYIGTSTSLLKLHLEGRFEIGMTWQNYGISWHIDHMIPCAFWDQRSILQSTLCWHYHNLNPLWAISNKSKKDKINHNRLLYYTTFMKMLLFDL